jgi:hypothetical protein
VRRPWIKLRLGLGSGLRRLRRHARATGRIVDLLRSLADDLSKEVLVQAYLLGVLLAERGEDRRELGVIQEERGLRDPVHAVREEAAPYLLEVVAREGVEVAVPNQDSLQEISQGRARQGHAESIGQLPGANNARADRRADAYLQTSA